MAIPFKFIHGADLHIDSPFKGLKTVPAKVRESLLEATFVAFERLVNIAISEQASFIVISGDLFDESDRSLRAQLFLLQQYERLQQHHIHIYIIHGNHDHMGGKRVPFPYPENVHIFRSDQVTTMPAYDATGQTVAYVHGISYPTRHVMENLAKSFEVVNDSSYHIGLYHGSVGNYAAHDPYAACQLIDLLQCQYQYWALGHIHKRQVLHQQPYVVYCGNSQGRHRNESGDKGCYIVEVDMHGSTSLKFESLAYVRWELIEINIKELDNEAQLIAEIQQQLQLLKASAPHAHLLVSFSFIGSGYVHQLMQQPDSKEQLLEHLELWFDHDEAQYWTYVYEINDYTTIEYDESQLLQEESFASDLLHSYAELISDGAALDMLYEQAMESLQKQPAISKWLRKQAKPSHEQLIIAVTEAKQHAIEQLISKQRQGARE